MQTLAQETISKASLHFTAKEESGNVTEWFEAGLPAQQQFNRIGSGNLLSLPNRLNENSDFGSTQLPVSCFQFGKVPVHKHSAPHIQPKLAVNTPGDKYEQEADAVADKITSVPETGSLQRKCAGCEEEEKLQRKPLSTAVTPVSKSHDGQSATVNASLSSNIISSKGRGQMMDNGTHSFMSGRFGFDFSKVRIHADDESVSMNRELNAKAFTLENDIYFNRGEYQPGSTDGLRLLAHELVHTIQQSRQLPAIQRKEDKPKDINFYQDSTDYCRDSKLTGMLHENKTCFREIPKRTDYHDCPPGHHICFDDKTGKFSDEHTDKIAPVGGKKKDGTCKLHGQCALTHAFKDKVMEEFAKNKNIDPKVTLPGEGEPRNTDLF